MPRRLSRPTGFTLIELVMVLVILSALAAMVIPIVDNIRRTSDKATASGVMKQAVENVSLYRIQTGKYPTAFDSLMEGSSALSVLKDAENYQVATLTKSEEEGLVKIGIDQVMDHDLTAAYRGNPGNSGVINRPLSKSGQSQLLVVTNGGDLTSQGQAIINSVYPPNNITDSDNNNHTDVATDGSIIVSDGDGDLSTEGDQVKARLVVLGLGPNVSAVGKTMVSAPSYPGVDGLTQYNRFLVMFAVYEGPSKTKRAQLKGALDSAGDFLDQELIEVAENNLE